MEPIRRPTDEELLQLVRRAAALQDAPTSWQRSAIRLWPAQPERAPLVARVAQGADALMRSIVAVLSFDSWALHGAALGVRSAGTADVRQLLFSAEGRDIDVRMLPQADCFAVEGQVLGPDECGQVELSSLSGTAETRTAKLDALGEFRFDGLAAGLWQLKLRTGGDEVVLPTIEIGARRT